MRVARGSSARRGWGAIPSPAWSEVATAARCGEARKGRIRPSLAWIWRGGGGCGSAGPARCGGRRRLGRRWHGWPMQGGGRQRRLPGAAAAPPLTCSARSPGGSPRRGQRGSPVHEQPLACGGLSSSAARPRWLLGVSGWATGMPPRWLGEVRQPDNGGTGEWRRSGVAAPPAARW